MYILNIANVIKKCQTMNSDALFLKNIINELDML